MPASGARSGTRPSRADRGAGTGRIGPTPLACGHHTHALEPVTRIGRRPVYHCPHGCGLQDTAPRKRAAG